jgi:radical SAM superfamily enzyme YgiQ (UPF0313 family)
MKVLLINPISGESQLGYSYQRLITPVPPMGLCYIGAVLEKSGHKVSIIDQYAYRMTNEALLGSIRDFEPDIVGFSCLTPCINNIKILSRRIKAAYPGVKIILGNLHATIFADDVLKERIADIVVRGEGDYSTAEVVSALDRQEHMSSIRGISYRNNGAIHHNEDRLDIADLDSLPYPAWHLLDWKYYNKAPMLGLNEPAIPIRASRGCCYSCIFCAQDKICKTFRLRNINRVIDEMEHIYKRYQIRNFVFCDSFFPHSNESTELFCDGMMSRGLHKKVRWFTELRSDGLRLPLLKKMKQSGLHLIMFGFESGNQKILDSMDKRAKVEQSLGLMEMVRKEKILTLGFFMLGMPQETMESCKDTIKFAKQLDCDIVKFNIVIPYPGTQLYEKNKDKINPRCSFDDFTSWNGWLLKKRNLPFTPETMTQEELFKMQAWGMFSYYARLKVIIRCLRLRIMSVKEIAFGGIFIISKCLYATIRGKNNAGR